MRIRTSQVAEVCTFAAAVADLTVQCPRPFIELDGFAGIAQSRIRIPQVAEIDPLTLFVS